MRLCLFLRLCEFPHTYLRPFLCLCKLLHTRVHPFLRHCQFLRTVLVFIHTFALRARQFNKRAESIFQS